MESPELPFCLLTCVSVSSYSKAFLLISCTLIKGLKLTQMGLNGHLLFTVNNVPLSVAVCEWVVSVKDVTVLVKAYS